MPIPTSFSGESNGAIRTIGRQETPVESNGLGLLPAETSHVLSVLDTAMLRLSDETDAVCREWRRLVVTHGVSGKKSHDARLVAAMMVHGLSRVLTFNVEDFRRFPGIVAIHPDDLLGGGARP